MESYVPSPEFVAAKGKKGKKSNVDPARPKRPLSAFMCYCSAMRPTIKAENPDFKMTEITSELAARWRGLNDTEKAPFNKTADEDKARYLAEMEAFRGRV
eukprot:Plantae.Rhodophyta-Rhodochaete_pulchella.ctg58724.p1 GENE.Plantae.Rhodophyta-Rhodochaete_pulchella.ctg58724~~Plantae.Rhodophyta-Rhodochaete_pulchella.ctg58724.p1  ORF type:complete len:108 (+),score=22.19 Plantae.Rhodophyta-Rhodochaete_pulchella.ctg58724:26-325(+)